MKVRLGREGSGSEWRGPLSPIAGNARDTEGSFQKQNLVRLQTPSSPTPPQSLGPARPQRQAQREKDLTFFFFFFFFFFLDSTALFSLLHEGVTLVQVKSRPQMVTLYKL